MEVDISTGTLPPALIKATKATKATKTKKVNTDHLWSTDKPYIEQFPFTEKVGLNGVDVDVGADPISFFSLLVTDDSRGNPPILAFWGASQV